MSSPPLICIVEDAKALRTSVADLTRADDYATAEFVAAPAFRASHGMASRRGVIAAIQLQGMTGVDLRGAMFAQGLSTPVMIIAALGDDRWRKRAAEAAAVFLRKPLDAKPRFGLPDRNQPAAGAAD